MKFRVGSEGRLFMFAYCICIDVRAICLNRELINLEWKAGIATKESYATGTSQGNL